MFLNNIRLSEIANALPDLTRTHVRSTSVILILEQIPRITLCELENGACDIAHLLETFGACILKDALPQTQSKLLKEKSLELFSKSEMYLRQFSRKTIESAGYTAPGGENVRGLIPIYDRHFFDIFRNTTPEVFPPEHGQFAEVSKEIYNQLETIGMKLVVNIGKHVRQPQMETDVRSGRHMLRVAEYLIKEKNEFFLPFPSHRDFGLLTLFLGGAEPGLQILLDGKWYDSTLNHGEILVSPGTTMSLYAPKIKALSHRVTASSEKRLSVVLFTEPASDAILPNGTKAGDRLRNYLSKISNH